MRWLALSALGTIAADQVSKLIVVHWLSLKTLGRIEVWPPYLTFRMGWNTGVNFGLFSNNAALGQYVLTGIAVAVSLWLVVWARRAQFGRGQCLAIGAIVGGALANALDRVVYGAVADFLNMSCCGIANPYAFNLADVGIFAGVAGLLILGTGEKTP